MTEWPEAVEPGFSRNWRDPATLDSLQTIGDFIRWCSSELTRHGVYFGHGTDNAWDEATFLVLSAVHQPLTSGNELLGLRVIPDEKQRIANWLQARVETRQPLPYITGEAWFAGKPYHVTPQVLVPRSPFAEVLSEACAPWLDHEPDCILDMCTGSGCIGIEAAFVFPEAAVDLVDISPEALAVAQRNIERYQLAGRVRAIESDGFQQLGDRQYDLILANPPYVDAEDLADMPEEFQHEPALALGSGADGLDLTRQLLSEAPRHLTPEGVLFIEVGNSAPALEAAFPELPFTWLELADGGHGIAVLRRSDFPTPL